MTSKTKATKEYPALRALLASKNDPSAQILSTSQAGAAKTALEYIIFLSDVQLAQTNIGSDFKSILKDILDWHNPKFTQATGPLVKALGQFFITPDTYALGADILGYLALWSPLLPSERLLDILNHAKETPNPYRPSSSFIGMSGQLNLLCQSYSPNIRLALAKSLWDSTHKGKWWTTFAETAAILGENGLITDVTKAQGLVALVQNEDDPPRQEAFRNNNRPLLDRIQHAENFLKDLLAQAQAASATNLKSLARTRQQRAQDYTESLLENPEELSLSALVEHLQKDTLIYDERIIPYLQHASREGFNPEALWKVSRRSFEIEEAALLVWIKEVPSRYRPETPLPLMISAALEVNGGARALRTEELPKKPQAWSNLFDRSFLESNAKNEFKAEIPTSLTAEALKQKFPSLDFHVVSSTAELYNNAIYMNNCTGGLLNRLSDGSSILYQINDNGLLHNVHFTKINGKNGWHCAETKARFNSPTTSPGVRSATEYIAAELSHPLHAMKI